MNYKNDDNNYDAFVTKTIVALIFVSRDWGFGRQIRRLKTLDFRGGAGGGGEGPRLRIAIIMNGYPIFGNFVRDAFFGLLHGTR